MTIINLHLLFSSQAVLYILISSEPSCHCKVTICHLQELSLLTLCDGRLFSSSVPQHLYYLCHTKCVAVNKFKVICLLAIPSKFYYLSRLQISSLELTAFCFKIAPQNWQGDHGYSSVHPFWVWSFSKRFENAPIVDTQVLNSAVRISSCSKVLATLKP